MTLLSLFLSPLLVLIATSPTALSMQSSSLGDWLPVIIVTVFNAGDTLGRLVSRRVSFSLSVERASLSTYLMLTYFCFQRCNYPRVLPIGL